MAMENKRIIQLSTERTNLTSDDYVMVDSDADGSAKYRLDRLKETDTTLSVSGKAADAAATGSAISDEATARELADTAIEEDIDDLKSAIDEIERGTNLIIQKQKSDADKAWGDSRFDVISYAGQVLTITNNGATYILIEARDDNDTAIGTATRINSNNTASIIVSIIPDHYIVYCDTYPIDVSIQSPSSAAHLESQIDIVDERLKNVAIDYLEGIVCYANLSDFDLTQNKYYANDLTPQTPSDSNIYHIAQPFTVPAGTYAFYGIDSYWSFHVLANGTKTRFGTGDASGTITVSQPATIYLTTRENIMGYVNANLVSGNDILATNLSKGYFSKKIERIDGFVQIMASVNMFNSVAALGDSYTAASVKNSAGTWTDYPNNSWVATMCKRSGVDWYNYGVGGATIKSYANTNKFNNQVLGDSPRDIYFICFGINDFWQSVTLGSIADINDADYTQNADSFYGWYGRVIAQLKNHAPNARIIPIKAWTYDAAHSVYGDAIETIAEHYDIPYIDPYDDVFFSGGYFEPYHNAGHPTLMGYDMMGVAMERLFSECVVNNASYFKYSTVG